MKQFIITLLVAAAVVGGVVIGMGYSGLIPAKPTSFWEIIVFLIITTAVLFRFVVRAEPGAFVQTFLLTMVLKLLGYGAFLFFVILPDRQNAVPNVVLFLTGYLVFTAIEIFYLHRKTRG